LSTVLIVDDQAIVRAAVRDLFESHSGFEVCGEAENGADAIVKARALKPDLIILDLSMPLMNGFEAARTLRQILPAVPVFLLTAHHTGATEQAAFDVGIRAVFSKYQGLDPLIAQARVVLKSRSAA
jgi:DNA-binding NarL/FixJ family response regulator